MKQFIEDITQRITVDDTWTVKITSLIIDEEKTGYDALTVLDFAIENVDDTSDDTVIINCRHDEETYSLKWFIEMISKHISKEIIFDMVGVNNELVRFKYDGFDIGHSDKSVVICLKQ